MKKRLTDAQKWQDEWFDALTPCDKLFWMYLLDTCDHAGIWKPNLSLASYHVGCPLDVKHITEVFKGRITVLKNGRWMINKFVEFQYDSLSTNSRVHQSVINILLKNGVEYDQIDTQLVSVEKENKNKRLEDLADEIVNLYPKRSHMEAGKKEVVSILRKDETLFEMLRSKTMSYAEARRKADPSMIYTVNCENFYKKKVYNDPEESWSGKENTPAPKKVKVLNQ